MIHCQIGADEIICTGHAGFRRGSDSICAAVSAAMCGLAGTLERENIPHEVRLISGNSRVHCPAPDARTAAMFRVTAVTLTMLSETFPDFIRVTEKEEP